MSVIPVQSNLKNYTAQIGPLGEDFSRLARQGNTAFVVDENVWQLYADTLLRDLPREATFSFPAFEDKKNLAGVQEIYDHLLDRSAKRNLTLVTIGGGILQDVTGFVASTLYRGIRWILIPTTLLAQADSCIGSKTSLNYKGYKNLVGTFFPPDQVWIDPAFLITLRTEDFFSGLGEVVKLHIMGGEQKIQRLLQSYPAVCARDAVALEEAIQSSLEIKLSFIAGDEFDLGRRNMLNYGHCVGHALEAVSDFRVPHGQAVVIGMILANALAQQRGLLSAEKRAFLDQTLLLPSLKVPPLAEELHPQALIDAMGKDKKRTGQGLVVVMLTDSGEMVRIDTVEPAEVCSVLSAAQEIFLIP